MESLITELHPYIVQGLGALILAIFAALAGVATLAANALRQWLTTKNLIGLRSILDGAIENARKDFTPDKVDVFAADAAEKLAAHFAAYARRTIPETLDKIGFSDAQLNERMMKEAAAFIEYTKRYVMRERLPNTGVIAL